MSQQMSTTDFELARTDPKLANVLYHDWESESYDDKWSISFDDRCISYAAGRFTRVAGQTQSPYTSAMEIGCGTGFFALNLMQAGIIDSCVLTDISPGMVAVATRQGLELGLDVEGRVADAERLPSEDNQCDLVIGHAVLHHIPDVEQALREALRVLRPGGRFVFCGEPTARGDVVARALSRLTWWTTTRVTQWEMFRDRWAKPPVELQASSQAAALESLVDIHTFDPDTLARTALRAGAVDVTTVTEELTASWFGWPVRTFEAAVKPGVLGWPWANFAYRTWQRLTWLDETVMEHIVPDELFYNVCITGVKP